MDSQEKFEKESDRTIGITGITICDIDMEIERLSVFRGKVHCNSNTCRSIVEVFKIITKTDSGQSDLKTELNNNDEMSKIGLEKENKKEIINQHLHNNFTCDSNNKSDLEKDISMTVERLISLLQEAKSSLGHIVPSEQVKKDSKEKVIKILQELKTSITQKNVVKMLDDALLMVEKDLQEK